MTAVYLDTTMSDDERRAALYAGDVFLYSARPSVLDFVHFARNMIEEAFGDADPRRAQYDMSAEDFAALLTKLKPAFIHHPESKEHIREILRDLGCDTAKTYLDVPRMRSSTSDNYLTTGIAYAFHPHRDTWYSAPMMQLNWWLPIYEVQPSNVMAFHPRYWSEPVANGSAEYNYYEWNRTGRPSAGQHVGTDTRKQPKPEQDVELDPQIRVIPPVGGVMLFSGAQFHSSVPNDSGVTRYSIDFRSVHIDDVKAHGGAPNVDSYSTGTTMRDYLRATDYEPLPDSLVSEYDTEARSDEPGLVYRP
jgi:hypothetical protein